jgi:hypothetical protein
MSTDTIRQLLEERVQMEFPVYQPTVPVTFANTRFDQSTGPWIYVVVIPNYTERAALANQSEFESCGIVNVTCMVPEMTGTKHIREIADAVAKVLLDRQIAIPGGGHITTYGLQNRERGVVSGWYTINVIVMYRARVRIVR